MGLFGHLEERGSMVDTRRGTHDDRRVVALGQIEGGPHHGEALLGRGRIEHRHLREGAEPTRVLLGLGGDGARIVGHEQHAAAARAHVVQRHERIGSDIEPHLLAGEQHPRAAVGRAGQHLERRLLVGGPFHMHVLGRARRVQLRHSFHQLGRRRARIARHHVHPGFQSRVGKRLIAHQKFLHHVRSATLVNLLEQPIRWRQPNGRSFCRYQLTVYPPTQSTGTICLSAFRQKLRLLAFSADIRDGRPRLMSTFCPEIEPFALISVIFVP